MTETLLEDTPADPIPDTPHWSENFAIGSFDPQRKIHFFSHIGRWRKDMSQWRELFKLCLPDGTTIMHRSIGNRCATPTGPGGSNLDVEVVKPFEQLRWRFLGAAERMSSADAFGRLPKDGSLERVEFDLLFSSDLPMWQLGEISEEVAVVGQGHTEQLGRLSGTIKVGNQSFEFDSMANRDHSRGPRVVDPVVRHIWMQGVFENGLSFLAYDMQTELEGPVAMSKACVYEDGKLFPATFEPDYRLPTGGTNLLEKPFGIKLEYEKGSFDIQVTEYPNTGFIQFTSPWDLYVGRRQVDDEPNHCVAEQSATYMMDGKVAGYGHIERGVPGKIILDP